MGKLRVTKLGPQPKLNPGKVVTRHQKVTVQRWGGMQSGANPFKVANSWLGSVKTSSRRRSK